MFLRMTRGLKHLDARDWGWFHFKFAIGIVVPILALSSAPAPVTSRSLDSTLVQILLWLMIVGASLSVLGILLRGTKVQPLIVGYSIEIVGLIFLFTGPFMLMVGYGYVAYTNGSTYTAAGLCYALASALASRFIDVYFHALESKEPGESRISQE